MCSWTFLLYLRLKSNTLFKFLPNILFIKLFWISTLGILSVRSSIILIYTDQMYLETFLILYQYKMRQYPYTTKHYTQPLIQRFFLYWRVLKNKTWEMAVFIPTELCLFLGPISGQN